MNRPATVPVRRLVVVAGLALAALFAITTFAVPAHAQDTKATERARALVHAGRDKRSSGALAAALEDFKRAHEIMGVPTTGLEVARTQMALGQFLEAQATLLEVTRAPAKRGEPAVFARTRAEARTLIETLTPRLATLTIALADGVEAEALVKLDNEPVGVGKPITVNPGLHEVMVSVEGGASKRRTIRLSEGGSETVSMSLAPAPAAAPVSAPPARVTATVEVPARPDTTSRTRTNPLTYVGGAVLAAGAITGSISGGLTLWMRRDIEGRCAGGCTPEMQSEIDRGKTAGTISTVAFAVAGAGALLLVYGLLSPKNAETRALARSVSAFTF